MRPKDGYGEALLAYAGGRPGPAQAGDSLTGSVLAGPLSAKLDLAADFFAVR